MKLVIYPVISSYQLNPVIFKYLKKLARNIGNIKYCMKCYIASSENCKSLEDNRTQGEVKAENQYKIL